MKRDHYLITVQSAILSLSEFYGSHCDTQPTMAAITDAYSEPHRHYHVLVHIDQMLSNLDSQLLEPQDANELNAAILFHDIVYDPRANDNEERSAEVAAQMLEPFGIPADAMARIRDLILCTKTHQPIEGWPASALMLDLDLMILGSDPKAFDRYAQDIRKEYAFVPAEDYRIGRTKVLRSFIDREQIYLTEVFQAMYEARARENLTREIQFLQHE